MNQWAEIVRRRSGKRGILRAVMRRHRHPAGYGFTLVELMVVVVIAGVLALVGLRAMDGHIAASKSIEAVGMVQSIRSAQARHHAMTGMYLDVSREGGFFPRDPTGAAGALKTGFYFPVGGAAPPDNTRWLELNPTVAGPVQYGYMTRAGLPGVTMSAFRISVQGFTAPTPTESWYTVEAVGDTDGDGNLSHFAATSLSDAIFSEHETE